MFVADFFQPVDDFSVEGFLNGDVGHGGGGRSAVPVFFAGGEPDDVAGSDFLDGAAQALGAAAAGEDNQGLTQRMRVPGGAGAGFKGDAPATRAGAAAWNRGSMRTVPVNQSPGPLLDGCEPMRLISIIVLF